MANDPGGFFSLLPCLFCCLRKRARPADDDSRASSRSRSFSYSESSSDEDEYDNEIVNDQTEYGAKEDDKIAGNKAGYGATEDAKLTKGMNGDKGAVGEPIPSWNEIAEDYSIASPDLASSDEEEGEAITKPLESLTIVSEQIDDDQTGYNVELERKQAADPEPVNVQPVPSIEIDSVSPTLQPKESIKSKISDDSGVVVEKFSSLPLYYKSQSVVFSDDVDAISLQSATSTTSIDAAGLPKKKKKKLKLFKKFHFKKKSKLLAQQKSGYSFSTPTLGAIFGADDMSSNMSSKSKSRYSSNSLLASLDDVSDDDICKE